MQSEPFGQRPQSLRHSTAEFLSPQRSRPSHEPSPHTCAHNPATQFPLMHAALAVQGFRASIELGPAHLNALQILLQQVSLSAHTSSFALHGAHLPIEQLPLWHASSLTHSLPFSNQFRGTQPVPLQTVL